MDNQQSKALLSRIGVPQFHVKNASGAWQALPYDPALAGMAKLEADKLTAAGETIVTVDTDPAPTVGDKKSRFLE